MSQERIREIIRQTVIDYCHEVGGNIGFPTAIIDDAARNLTAAGVFIGEAVTVGKCPSCGLIVAVEGPSRIA